MVFSDVSRVTDYEKLFYIVGILLEDLENGSFFHAISWSLHKSKIFVKITVVEE